MEIKGKAAFVSGGGSGIGRATVLALVERGGNVVVADINEEAGHKTVTLAAGKGGSAVFVRCDVTHTQSLSIAIGTAIDQFGRLDIVVNNAGIGGVNLFDDNPGDWKRVIDIDLTAVIDATRIAVRTMKQMGNGGVIINTASQIGLYPMGLAPVYGAAKAGVVHFTRSLVHLSEDSSIRVNTICPELVDTPMAAQGLGETQMQELRESDGVLTPVDIADSILALIEDDSRVGAVLQITKNDGREYVTITLETSPA